MKPIDIKDVKDGDIIILYSDFINVHRSKGYIIYYNRPNKALMLPLMEVTTTIDKNCSAFILKESTKREDIGYGTYFLKNPTRGVFLLEDHEILNLAAELV